MKRSHIENIRKAVKQAGYKPTAEQIRAAILKVCPDGEVNQNKQQIVEEVIGLIESSSQIQTSKELVEVDDIEHELKSSARMYQKKQRLQ